MHFVVSCCVVLHCIGIGIEDGIAICIGIGIVIGIGIGMRVLLYVWHCIVVSLHCIALCHFVLHCIV